jgi:hypothetical protein
MNLYVLAGLFSDYNHCRDLSANWKAWLITQDRYDT